MCWLRMSCWRLCSFPVRHVLSDSLFALFLDPVLKLRYLCLFAFTMSEYLSGRDGGVWESCPCRRICSMVVRVDFFSVVEGVDASTETGGFVWGGVAAGFVSGGVTGAIVSSC